jgi:hypothetical protein
MITECVAIVSVNWFDSVRQVISYTTSEIGMRIMAIIAFIIISLAAQALRAPDEAGMLLLDRRKLL